MVLPVIMGKESHRRINGNGSVSEGCTDFISVGQRRKSSLEKVLEFWRLIGGVDKQNEAAQSSGVTCSGHSEGEVESHAS